MRMSFVKMAVAAGALVVAMTAPAAAQSGMSVGANLTFLRAEGDPSETGAGFSLEFAKGFTRNVALLGEFGLNSFQSDRSASHLVGVTFTSYLVGVRYIPAVEAAFQPFVQGLFGVEHFRQMALYGLNGFAFQPGGGVEVPFNRRLRFRAQYDYRRASYPEGGYNGHRFGVGVVVPIGGS